MRTIFPDEIRHRQEVCTELAQNHAHYKGLATKADAEKWFAVKPNPSGGKMI
jgi:hypothetical protein